MKKYVLLVSLVVLNAYANTAYQQKVPNESENDILTSQEYVNDRVGRSQDKIQPLPVGTTVDKIVATPATAGGTPGARDIVTDLTNGTSDGIPTASAVYTATDAKNDKMKTFNHQNVATYTGTTTNSDYSGPGILAGTPIYSREANTFENGLVRASTLNEAVQYAIDHELTRNDSDPQGTLWDVTALTAPAPLPVTANLPAKDMGRDYCYKPIRYSSSRPGRRGECTETRWGPDVGTPNEYSHAGDWGIVFNYETGIAADGVICTGANRTNCNKEIRGISACISEKSSGAVQGTPVTPSLSTTLNNAYETNKNGFELGTNDKYCYCKLTAPNVSGTNGSASRWIYYYEADSYNTCAGSCALNCGFYISRKSSMRSAIFSATDQYNASGN